MKFIRIFLSLAFIFSFLQSADFNAASKKKNSYIELAKSVDKGKLKIGQELTRAEKRVIKSFINGDKLKKRDLKHFEAAILKYKYLKLKKKAKLVFGRKKLNLKKFPKHNDVGDWYIVKPKPRMKEKPNQDKFTKPGKKEKPNKKVVKPLKPGKKSKRSIK